MKKVILEDIRKIKIVNVPEPDLAEGEVLIEMKACGLCGGDIAAYQGKNLDLNPLPLVCGHEFGGIIIKINGTTDKLKVGDKVVVNPTISCGECLYCKQGLNQHCIGLGDELLDLDIGTKARDGALAEKVTAPLSNIIKLPDDFDMDLTGIIEPASVAYNNIRYIKNSNVLIIGVGSIGLIALKMLRLNNNKVIVVDISEKALDFAKKTGADFTANIKDKKIIKKIKDFLNNEYMDYTLLYFVDDYTVKFASDITKITGEIRFIGFSHKEFVKVDVRIMLIKSLRWVGHYCYTMKEFKKIVKLIIEKEKELNLKELIIAKFPLEKVIDAFNYKEKGYLGKVIVTN